MKNSNPIKRSVCDCVLHNGWFKFFSLISVGLIIASFFIPPVSVIDGSVLAAVGELFGFAALGTVIKAIDNGVDAKIEHKGTSLTVGNLQSESETIEEENG